MALTAFDNLTGKIVGLFVDVISKCLPTINWEHYKIHESKHYFIEKFNTISSGATLDLVFEVPAGAVYPHAIFSIDNTNGEVELQRWKTITANSDGTSIGRINNNFNSSNTPVLVCRDSPTGISTVGGTMYANTIIGSGTTPVSRSPGSSKDNNEKILKPSEKYLMRIINNSGASNKVSWSVIWYE
jgi:hypothetical protein